MKPIVIQGAMSDEIEYYLEVLEDVREETIGRQKFFHGFYQGYPVIVSLTGIGMVNCSVATTWAGAMLSPAFIINQGIVGAHREELNVGDIIIGERVVSINSFEKPLEKVGVNYEDWVAKDFFDGESPYHGDVELVNLFDVAEYEEGEKIRGVLGTGDVWNRESEFIRWLMETRGTHCEDMESMAVHQVGEEFDVPVVGVRIVSNNELTDGIYQPEVTINLQKFIMAQMGQLVEFAKERGKKE